MDSGDHIIHIIYSSTDGLLHMPLVVHAHRLLAAFAMARQYAPRIDIILLTPSDSHPQLLWSPVREDASRPAGPHAIPYPVRCTRPW